MHIATLGDVMLDVIVEVPDGLREDDDVEAHIDVSAGGQAANVAAWAVALGARATLIGPRGRTPSAIFVDDQLASAGIGVVAIDVPTTGKVVSIQTGGTRTLASDAGDQTWVQSLDPARVPIDLDWLHLSAYPLLRAEDPGPLLALVDAVRRRGVSISVDLASAGLIAAYGDQPFTDVLKSLAPRLVFATAAEWDELGLDQATAPFDLVVKRGADGAASVVGGVMMEHAALLTDVVDLTGAGDALAAGYLVGGIELGLATAARCVSQRGAQPSSGAPRQGRHRPQP